MCNKETIMRDIIKLDIPDEQFKPLLEKEVSEFSFSISEDTSLIPIILRFHLLTENCLERIIASKLPKGYLLVDNAGFTYHHKLELVHAIGIFDEKIIGSLRKLNQIRNDCSHNRHQEINADMIESVGRPLGKDFINIKRENPDDIAALTFLTFSKIFSEIIAKVLVCEYSK
jgi:hypothetical protein